MPTDVTHHMVEANGIRMHIAEQGTGPTVLLCHGFPELWYSWRHQLSAARFLAGTRGTRLRARYWGDCYPRDQVLTVPPGALGLCQIAIRAIGSRQ